MSGLHCDYNRVVWRRRLAYPDGNRYGYGYSFGDPDGYSYGYSNSDRHDHGYSNPDGNCVANAAAYPDTETASDPGPAPDAITVTGTIKAGTREKNSRVPRPSRIDLTRSGHGTFKQSWHFPNATPGGLKHRRSLWVPRSRAESN